MAKARHAEQHPRDLLMQQPPGNHKLTLFFDPEFGDPVWAGIDYELTAPGQPQGEWVLGRSPLAQITINMRTVSGKHAAIGYSFANDSWLLSDLASENGTYLNGKRVEPPRSPRPIVIGDRIDLGPRARIQVVENAQDTIPDELELGPPTIASTTPLATLPTVPPSPPSTLPTPEPAPSRTWQDSLYLWAQWGISASTVPGKIWRMFVLAVAAVFVVVLLDLLLK